VSLFVGIYVFSWVDCKSKVEYVVVVNNVMIEKLV